MITVCISSKRGNSCRNQINLGSTILENFIWCYLPGTKFLNQSHRSRSLISHTKRKTVFITDLQVWELRRMKCQITTRDVPLMKLSSIPFIIVLNATTRSVQLVVKGQVEKYSTSQSKGQLTALQIHYPNHYQVALADNSRRGCSSSSEFVMICDTGDCMKHTRWANSVQSIVPI